VHATGSHRLWKVDPKKVRTRKLDGQGGLRLQILDRTFLLDPIRLKASPEDLAALLIPLPLDPFTDLLRQLLMVLHHPNDLPLLPPREAALALGNEGGKIPEHFLLGLPVGRPEREPFKVRGTWESLRQMTRLHHVIPPSNDTTGRAIQNHRNEILLADVGNKRGAEEENGVLRLYPLKGLDLNLCFRDTQGSGHRYGYRAIGNRRNLQNDPADTPFLPGVLKNLFEGRGAGGHQLCLGTLHKPFRLEGEYPQLTR
jgi:hypothetical protein